MKTKLFTILFVAFLLTNSVTAATYFVRENGSNSNDGITDATAFKTLDKVLGLPNLTDGDIINVLGEYSFPSSRTLKKSITIQGNDKAKTVFHGEEGTMKGFMNIGNGNTPESPVNLIVENITFKNFNNYNPDKGASGAVFNVNLNSSLKCKNSDFVNNTSYLGGAINMTAGSLILEDCYLAKNKVMIFPNNIDPTKPGIGSDGGAICVSLGSIVKINGVETPNTYKVTMNVDRCTFEGNSADRNGSAIRFRTETTGEAKFIIQNSTFYGNHITAKTPEHGATIIIENNAQNAEILLLNNTIAYNTTELNKANAKAGIAIVGSIESQAQLINNIVFANSNFDKSLRGLNIYSHKTIKVCKNNITDDTASQFNFDKKTEKGASISNINAATADQLGLATSLTKSEGSVPTLAISAQSIAANTGATVAPTTDQRGVKRDKTPDVGAYEYKK